MCIEALCQFVWYCLTISVCFKVRSDLVFMSDLCTFRTVYFTLLSFSLLIHDMSMLRNLSPLFLVPTTVTVV